MKILQITESMAYTTTTIHRDSSSSSESENSYSTLREDSFSMCDSSLNQDDNSCINPFGSFKQKGPLPYSLFNDSSSFSSSPAIHRSTSKLENSTHIYMNLIDESSCSDFSLEPVCQEPRSLGDGKEASVVNHHQSLSTPSRKHIAKNLKKLGKFLHGSSAQSFTMKTLAVL